jgi:phosphoenolpyruvate---glycerone phosphotransferase subunit DhaL
VGHSGMQDTELVVKTIAQTAMDNEQYFCELDAAAGDGDFGYSLARGFGKLLEDWENMDRSDPGTFLKKAGMTITSRIGGTSGPIWGTGFLRAGMVLGDKESPTQDDVIAALRSAIEGIKQRGNTDVGDKTLLDALVPAVDKLEESLKNGTSSSEAIEAAAQQAHESAEATKGMVAQRGRASYTGDRSRASVDAGAMGVAVMAKRVSTAWKEAH